jgi:hypothetical protein
MAVASDQLHELLLAILIGGCFRFERLQANDMEQVDLY